MTVFAVQEGWRCRLGPVPWKPIYGLFRAGEFLRLCLPFRTDSLLGLVQVASSVMKGGSVAQFDMTLSAFAPRPTYMNISART